MVEGGHAGLWTVTCRPRRSSRRISARFELLGVAAVEVVCPEIAIRLVILEHVKHDDQNRMPNGHDGALFAFARGWILASNLAICASRNSNCSRCNRSTQR